MVPAALIVVLAAAQPASDLRRDGAFGFPQGQSTVLCDTPTVRLSAWNDREFLFVQAVLFTDDDNAPGETDDGREIGDWSDLNLDVDADGKATSKIDRNYTLNPWPSLPGLHYSTVFDESSSSGLTADSKGRGAISYVNAADGKRARVDSYLIPLAEIGRKPGEDVRFAYWGASPHPDLVVNSVGFKSEKKYYAHQLPRKSYHTITLADRPRSLDEQLVPEGRTMIALDAKPGKAMPEVGKNPPAVTGAAWFNWKGPKPPTLADLKGKVVVVEFWATWCGPCVAGIPHLNELHDKFAEKGLVILSMTDQKAPFIEKFVKEKSMRFVIGAGSKAVEEYGVTGIPYAFVVARDGTLAWNGYPADNAFDKTVEEELAK